MVERSIKVSAASVADGRLLVSTSRRSLLPGAKRTFHAICDALHAPDINSLLPYLSVASEIHFGFEPGDDPICKAYLEFDAETPVANVRFMAVKWRGGVARTNLYFDRSSLPSEERDALKDEVIPHGPIRDVFEAVIRRAASVAPLHDLPLLLVEEAASARRSLDLNVADLDWHTDNIADLIAPVFPNQQLPAHLDNQRIGHVAAGAGRDAEPFFTLYYGAHAISPSRMHLLGDMTRDSV